MSKFDYTKISGEEYDWRATRAPELPYIHDYRYTFTYKILIATRSADGTETTIHHTFEEALEIIKKVDRITLGEKKIVYLVGWQYNGHDSKYPAFHEVNAAAKRDCDKNARESLLWLMDEAFKYNTTVSFHINMSEAYPDSPLWDEYVEHGLIATEKDGSLKKSGVWGGMQGYCVNLVDEWNTGYTAKRIDELCELFPIERAGTIHIDAFLVRQDPDPGHGHTFEEMAAARCKIFRYFRAHGIDVTSELVYFESGGTYIPCTDHCIGLQPLALHFSQSLQDYIDRPASLLVGILPSRMFRGWDAASYGSLFGASFHLEVMLGMNKDGWQKECLGNTYFRDLRQKYLNSLDRERVEIVSGLTRAYFSDGVVTDTEYKITKNGATVSYGCAMFLPLVSTTRGKYYFFSTETGKFSFDVKTAYGIEEGTKFTVREMTTDGLSDDATTVVVKDGLLEFEANEAERPLILE